MIRPMALALLFTALIAAGPAAAETELPAVARPSFDLGGSPASGGTAFFIRVNNGVGTAAVGTAHGFALEAIIQADEVEFVLGQSKQRVAGAAGFLVRPGRSFTAPGATLREDFNVYALTTQPKGVRTLRLSGRNDLTLGTRVRILGIPAIADRNEITIRGKISELGLDHIEVDLEMPIDLHGWGGAPVLEDKSGEVIGILQANSQRKGPGRVSVGPIGGVIDALRELLEDGAGRPFASFSEEVDQRATAPPETAKPKTKRKAPPLAPPGTKLITQVSNDGTHIQLQIDFPEDGSVVSDSICGTYVAGRAIAHHGELRNFDVVFVLDSSRSTVDPTGSDINGNGIVGKPRLGQIGSIFDVGSTDPGDSILAAEVAAARQLLRGLDPRSTRVGVVRFAGEPPGSSGGIFSRPPTRAAVTMQALTDDYQRVELALNSILLNEPAGQTHIAAGIDQAIIELAGLRGALSTEDTESEKVVLFFTDGEPTLPYGPGFKGDNVRAVLRAAGRANRLGVRIHSFAIGPDAVDGPIATVEMANRTNGYFTPVRHPGDLVEVIEEVSFANLSEIVILNQTTGDAANPLRMMADGSWGGFVKLDPGDNVVGISVFADDGAEASTTLALRFESEAPDVAIPRGLVGQRNRLLEDCLIAMKRVRMKAEDERNELVRRELKMEIERDRLAARNRAEEQRKELRIGIDEGDDQRKQLEMDIDEADRQRQQLQMDIDKENADAP